ncbi:MAG: hypothetical protein WCO11_00230 [Sphingomonadales bacterium]|jgi:Arc/MetJ-type ribon-helix-helix transcriptional regulator
MATAHKSLMLPDETLAQIDALVSAGHAADRTSVVADLVARELAFAAKRRDLDAAIDAGIASPSSGASLDDILNDARRRHGRP